MQFLKKSFFGLIWSIGLFFLIALIVGVFLAPGTVSESSSKTFKEGYAAGYEKGREFGRKYSTILLLVPLAIGFGGSFMGILPGTRKKSKKPDNESA